MAEKPRAAAALSYAPEKDAAPRVVAAGKGRVAERIIAVARESGVPVYHDPELAWTLAGLGVDIPIPPQLYEVVARVIAWVYELEAGMEKTER
ncbi:MAG: EscU/YscU/HrcU family type III secretion system export apparatus switch protein [Bacillota bacterium]